MNKIFSIIVAIICAIFIIAMILWRSHVQAVAPSINDSDKVIVTSSKKEPYYKLTDEEYKLVCDVVDLEAGGEGEELQRAVTEVILNRIESGIWGKTVNDVIYAKHQFEVVPWLWKANPSDLTKRVVKEVFDEGVTIPKRVMFFRTKHYHSNTWAIDEFSIGNVYFSSSKWVQ